jgi:hypothetical protein
MTLRREFATLPSKYDAFLFASIGEEEGGAPLSVMSVLVRADVDPWREAERLSMMGRDAAGRALSLHLSQVRGRGTSADVLSTSAGLLELLPKADPSASEFARTRPGVEEPVLSKSPLVLIVLGAAVALVWWIGG